MISGYARAFQALGDKNYLEKAIRAAEFLKNHLYNSESGTLSRNAYRDIKGLVYE